MRTINITLKAKEEHIGLLEDNLRQSFNVISYKLMPDTDLLYEKDPHFRKLCKDYRQARERMEKHINESKLT